VKLSRRALSGAILLALATAACGGGGGSHPPVMPTTAATKALWIANGTNVVEYLPSQLAAGTAALVPHLTLNSAAFGAPQGVQFDSAGNLWVIDGGIVAAGGATAPALFKFSAAQLTVLATTPNQAPSVTLSGAGFTFPQQAVFDKTGNLWVSDNGANSVFVFSAAQLAAGGTGVTPKASITSSTAFTGPLGIAFDSTGDLFVANNGGTTIEGFSAGSLPAGGTVTLTPSVVLSDDGQNSIQAPWALVFDAGGNLWSSNANAPNTVVEFAKASLAATGAPVPEVTLSPATVGGNSTLAAPNGLAFDAAGDLAAISSAAPFGVAIFGHAQLGASGTAVPSTFLVGTATTLNAPAGDVFGPVVN
jgi:sugar lactone lactonase YvrE